MTVTKCPYPETLLIVAEKVRANPHYRMSMYDKGFYRCGFCGIHIKHDDAKALYINRKNGTMCHEDCGKIIKRRPSACRGRGRPVKRI